MTKSERRRWYCEVGRRIVASRRAAGLSQLATAMRAGIQSSRLCRIECGRGPAEMRVREFSRVCAAIGAAIECPSVAQLPEEAAA